MLRNYLKTTLRNLLRNKTNAAINIFGLSLGLSCGIVLFLLADYHVSFDNYHQNRERIFRLVSSADGQGGERDHTTGVPVPLPDAVRNDFPDIEKVAFTSNKYGGTLVAIDLDTNLPRYFEEEDGIAYVEQEYLDIFDITWLEGNEKTALTEPNSIILSQELAKKYFPDKSALNQTIKIDKEYEMTVTGVMANPPAQSDFPFHMYISFASVKDQMVAQGWGSISSDDQCYVMLSSAQDSSRMHGQLKDFVVKYFGEENNNKVISLQPLSDLHNSTVYTNYNYDTVSEGNILAMRLIALFLVLTACVNFINLSTAMAVKRSREVGVRKVLGSTRLQLIKQFIGESFVIVLMAMAVALGLSELLVIYLNPFMELSITVPITNRLFLLSTFGLTLLITFLSGFYPALVISGFKPALAMKNASSKQTSGGMGVRKGLVIFQFFISQAFVIGTIVVITQLDYIRNQDLGFGTQAVLNVDIPEDNGIKKACYLVTLHLVLFRCLTSNCLIVRIITSLP